MQNKLIENTSDIIEDIEADALLSFDENLELDQETTEIAEANCDKENSDMEEAEVSSDEEFMEYAQTILKAAFGDKYDEEKAMETAKGILDKADGDYGAAIGMLTSGLGEESDMTEGMNDEDITEGSMDIMSLTDLWNKHAQHDYNYDQGSGSSVNQSKAAKAAIEKFVADKFGENVAADMVKASSLTTYEGEYADSQESAKTKADIAKLRKKHSVKPLHEDITVDCSDITHLVESEEGLTEEFKEKATTIFEAAVKSKIKEAEETLKESYAVALIEEVETIKEELVDKIDSYLTYAVESWAEDNAVAIESSLRTEIAENFIQSLKSVFVEHYIEVPETKKDLVSEMESEIAKLQLEAAESASDISALSEGVVRLTREKIIADASFDLADTQAEKLKTLVEDINFSSESAYRKKVNTIKEFYLNGNKSEEQYEELNDSSYVTKETIVENEMTETEVSPSMQKYLTALSRLNRANEATVPKQG